MVEPTKINPIIEFYEYQIHKYKPINRFSDFEKDNTTLFKFGNLTDSDDNKCRRVGIEGAITLEMDTQRTTCDPLTTLSGGEKKYKVFTTNENLNPFPIYDIENLYNNYKEFFAKYEVTDTLTINSVNKILKNLDDAIINQEQYIKRNSSTNNELNNYLNSYHNLSLENLIQINKSKSILINLSITSNTKVIIFGDFHGSYHTFFRLLCRLHKYDIIDLDTFKIKDNYIIMFLGDILDRGKYSLDIINIIFKLIAINNNDDIKIIYNRGNHETFDIFERDGSYDEFQFKIGTTNINTFLTKYIKLLNILPSAIVLNCEGNLFWCSHGGFPTDYMYNNFDLNSKILYLSDPHSTHIKWNDFGGISNDDYEQSSRGQNICKYTINGTNKFLTKNNINFIIRGHQDSYANSFLFKNDGNIDIIGDPNMKDKEQFLFYNNSIKAYGNRVEGPIARLKLNKDFANINKYFPVLTISTNTDTRRYLNSDSFALLRFDISEGEEHLFKNFLNSIKKINEVLQSNNINMSSIFINNLNIIIDMLKLIDTNTYYLFNYYAQNYSTLNLQKDNDNKVIDINEIFKILNFINDIHDDCIEFFKYYQQKYFNLHEKLTDLIKYNRIDNIQTNSIEKYLNSYKIKVDECKNILMKIKQNVNNFTDEQIRLLKQNDLFVLNDKLNQKLILLQKSSFIKS